MTSYATQDQLRQDKKQVSESIVPQRQVRNKTIRGRGSDGGEREDIRCAGGVEQSGAASAFVATGKGLDMLVSFVLPSANED